MSMFSSFEEMPTDLDALLDQPLSQTDGASAAQQVSKKNYQLLSSFQNVTSYSMQTVFKTCPREFMLMKLAAHTRVAGDRESVDFAYGHAIGAGVATYDKTRDLDKAIFAAFLAWNIDLFADDSYKRSPKNKSFPGIVIALSKYVRFFNEELHLDEYEQHQLEYTFSLDLEDSSGETDSDHAAFYVGHVDEIFKHRELNRFMVKENKSTGDTLLSPAKYSNSEQTTSYSAVIDALGGQDYDVMYTVYSSGTETWHQFLFPKDRLTKAQFLQDQLFIASDIKRYADANFFPKRGENCIRYGRECEWYGLCDIDPQKQFGMTFRDLPIVVETKELDAVERYDSHIKFGDLVSTLRNKSY
jgi:hypothetical protein